MVLGGRAARGGERIEEKRIVVLRRMVREWRDSEEEEENVGLNGLC